MNNDKRSIFVNPYYAIDISPDLVGQHQPIVAREDWIKTNAKLVEELGFEVWANQLLTVLEGGYLAATDADTTVQ